eukprot:4487921-Lingulodinium_polyedra.AAC.1
MCRASKTRLSVEERPTPNVKNGRLRRTIDSAKDCQKNDTGWQIQYGVKQIRQCPGARAQAPN